MKAQYEYCIGNSGGMSEYLLCRGDPIFHEIFAKNVGWHDTNLVGLYDGDMWAWRIPADIAVKVENGELTPEEAIKYEII